MLWRILFEPSRVARKAAQVRDNAVENGFFSAAELKELDAT